MYAKQVPCGTKELNRCYKMISKPSRIIDHLVTYNVLELGNQRHNCLLGKTKAVNIVQSHLLKSYNDRLCQMEVRKKNSTL